MGSITQVLLVWESDGLRVCTKCLQKKPLIDYMLAASQRLGRSTICRVCNNAHLKERRRKNSETWKRASAAWRKRNPEKMRAYVEAQKERYRLNPPPPRSPEQNAWSNMKTRCYNPNSANYKYYGARGITVCARWLKSFDYFLKDMGPKPTPQHSLDRINVNGNYTPKNCRWATQSQQMRNRRPRLAVDK